ncbi:MAG: hypothetical protein AB7O46_12435 [Xanthobacteraceae bacterium]
MAVKIMRAFCHAVIIGGLLLLVSIAILIFPASVRYAKADNLYVAGDSHGVALAQVAGLTSVAKNGAHTRDVPAQLLRLPRGATVFLFTGTNDAAARLAGFRAAVSAVLATAKERNQNLIWIGPVRSPAYWWDSYSDQADTFLALAVPNYVSMRAIDFTADERSGFHLTPKGYARLWRIVRAR